MIISVGQYIYIIKNCCFYRGNMNYNSDKPIEILKQDLLGRTTFSRQLGEAINSYDGKDGLVFGLFCIK